MCVVGIRIYCLFALKFLHEESFRADAGFLARVDALLAAAADAGQHVALVLFDAVWRPDTEGVQVLPRVHNSAWVQCPSHAVLRAFDAGDAAAPATCRKRPSGLCNVPPSLVTDELRSPDTVHRSLVERSEYMHWGHQPTVLRVKVPQRPPRPLYTPGTNSILLRASTSTAQHSPMISPPAGARRGTY